MRKKAGLNIKSPPHSDSDLECPICLDKFKHAVETYCGHCFCAECITIHLTKRAECPVCRHKIVSVHPSYTLRRVVENYFKKENIPLEEGHHKKQREVDANLQDVLARKQRFSLAAACRLHIIAIICGAILFGIVLQQLHSADKQTVVTKMSTVSPENLQSDQLNMKKHGSSQQPPPLHPFQHSPKAPSTPESALTLSHYASVGNVPSVVRLLEEGESQKQISLALIEAAKGGHHEVTKLLLRYGAELCLHDCAALVEASRGGHFTVVQVLLEAGALPNNAIADGMYAIHHAADQGHTSVVKRLLDSGALVNTLSSPYELTPLYLASRAGHTECVRLLLKRGAVVDAPSIESATPLYVAAEFGRTDVVKLLAGAGANIETYMQSGATPLVIATQKNFREIVEFLLRRAAKTGVVGANGMNALHLAAFNGHVECVRMLLEAATLTDEVDFDGNTALHHAVLKAWNAINSQDTSDIVGPLVSSISLLLRHGANPSPPPNKYEQVVETYASQSQVLARAFMGVRRIDCKIIPINTMDASSMLPMNSISSLREVILRVERDYSRKVSAIATSEFSDAIKVAELETTTFLSELTDPVVLRIFFKNPIP